MAAHPPAAAAPRVAAASRSGGGRTRLEEEPVNVGDRDVQHAPIRAASDEVEAEPWRIPWCAVMPVSASGKASQ
jgi:hypothetical protein